jgi:hypothetical protein
MLDEILCVFVLAVPSCLFGQQSSGAVSGIEAKDLYWMVEPNENILVRRPGYEHALTAKYNQLRPSDEVFCRAPIGRVNSTSRGAAAETGEVCSLWFITADAPKPQKLTDKIPHNRWVLLSSIKDVPVPIQLVKSSRELLEEMGNKTKREGLSKGSGCSGSLPLVAPACRDTIDLNDFSVEWTDPAGGGTYATLFVETIDELQSRSMRFDRIPLAAHRYESDRLRKYLEDIQKDTAPTSVSMRLSQSQNVEATRIVTVPSRVEQKGFHDELQMIKAQHALVRDIAVLSVYINFGCWSKAGKQARELLALAPDDEIVKTYALIGFCQSGYSRETEELRTSLKRLGITGICPAGQQ